MKTNLTVPPDSRGLLTALYFSVGNRHNGDKRPKPVDVARDIALELRQLSAAGNHAADTALMVAEIEALRRDWIFAKKQEARTTFVGRNGQTVHLTDVISTHVTDNNGAELPNYQLALFYHMTWAELRRALAREIKMRARLSDKIDFYYRVLKLQDQYPDAKTPADACEIAGIDTAEIASLIDTNVAS